MRRRESCGRTSHGGTEFHYKARTKSGLDGSLCYDGKHGRHYSKSGTTMSLGTSTQGRDAGLFGLTVQGEGHAWVEVNYGILWTAWNASSLHGYAMQDGMFMRVVSGTF